MKAIFVSLVHNLVVLFSHHLTRLLSNQSSKNNMRSFDAPSRLDFDFVCHSTQMLQCLWKNHFPVGKIESRIFFGNSKSHENRSSSDSFKILQGNTLGNPIKSFKVKKITSNTKKHKQSDFLGFSAILVS